MEIQLSTPLGLASLANTRDLGGMIGADGRRILPGKLFRSGLLARASAEDLEAIAQKIALVVDLRSDGERTLQPDPQLAGVQYAALPAVKDVAPGVTREEESLQAVIALMADPEKARAHMIQTYRNIMTSPFSLGQYAQFFQLLLEPRDKAVLWHCTAGKDRAGMAAFFVEKALGVADEALWQDYMITNEYLADEVEQLARIFASKGEKLDQEAVSYMFCAKTEFLEVVAQCIEESYGGYEAFFQEGLKLSAEDLACLRTLYLE